MIVPEAQLKMKEQQTWKRHYYPVFHEQNHQRVDLRQGCQGRRSQLRSCGKVLGGLFLEQISHADVYRMQHESPVHLVQTAFRLGLGFGGRESSESCCEWGCGKAPKGVQVYPKASAEHLGEFVEMSGAGPAAWGRLWEDVQLPVARSLPLCGLALRGTERSLCPATAVWQTSDELPAWESTIKMTSISGN